MKNHSFSKRERLRNRNDFQKLLSEGKSFYCYPFRCVYLWKDAAFFSARIAASVSKKRFKRAVDRNKVKRLIRENYRIEKGILYQKHADVQKNVDILLVYTETKILSFRFFKKKLIDLMNRIK